MFTIERDYRFEAARVLPRLSNDHPCSRLHGHAFGVTLVVRGKLDPEKEWVMDYYEIDKIYEEEVHKILDHGYLNEVEGLENPTTENVARWIFEKIRKEMDGLVEIVISEEGETRCRYGLETI